MRFYLGTHQPAWLHTFTVPLFISHRRLTGYRSLPKARCHWALDQVPLVSCASTVDGPLHLSSTSRMYEGIGNVTADRGRRRARAARFVCR
jgi:hypothetical protein